MLWGIAGLVIVLAVFRAGMVVGFHKAGYSSAWEKNYHQNFAGPRGGFMGDITRDFDNRDLIDAHGVVGQVVKIENSTIIIRGKAGTERIVVATDDTVIQRFRNVVSISDVKINDVVVVIGEPNSSGQIEAKFIRLMPPPPSSMTPPLRYHLPRMSI